MELATWLHQIHGKAAQMGLRTEYTVGKSVPTSNNLVGIHLVPIDFRITPESSQNAYRRCLKLLKTISEEQIRLDLNHVGLSREGPWNRSHGSSGKSLG